jgi:hypothetical protein
MKIARSTRALKAICGGRAVGADSPHIMDLDVDRPIDFDEKDQKVLCEQHYVKKFEALLNACSIFVHPTEEFISRGRRRFFYIELMNESYLTQSQADALIFGFLAADEENKGEHDDRYVVAK